MEQEISPATSSPKMDTLVELRQAEQESFILSQEFVQKLIHYLLKIAYHIFSINTLGAI
jgi:hypothetical protein